jgi:hemerythrin superfamily protein
MATATQSGAKKTTKSRTAPRKAAGKSAAVPDAVALLQADHREVKGWFDEYEKTDSDARKAKLSTQICQALKVHTQIEEEIFYPVSREYLKGEDEEMVDEAVVEHASAKDLIAEIEAMRVGDDLYDAKVKVLGEMIDHHVQEEEKEYFPACKKTEMDLVAVGAKLKARKDELMGQVTKVAGH